MSKQSWNLHSCVLMLLVLLLISTERVFAATTDPNASPSTETTLSDTELDRVYDQARDQWGAALYDGTDAYDFNGIQVSGNKLLTHEELFAELPVIFETEVIEDKQLLRHVYDFRVLHQLLNRPRSLEVSQKTMEGLTRYILERYQVYGYAGIYVYVRSESIKSGDQSTSRPLQLMVLEGRVSQIDTMRYDFKGESRDKGVLRESLFNAWRPIQTGDVIQKKELDQFVNLLNRNPDRQVRAVVTGSEEPNALDLRFDLYENNPWHFYTQVDSSGVNERQWNPRFGFLNTNLTGRDDNLSFMYQLALEEPDQNYATFGAYDIPVVTQRLRLGGYGGYSEYKISPQTSQGIANFLGDGYFVGAMGRYHLFQTHGWMCDALSTLSLEKSTVNPSLGIDSDVNMNMLGLGIDANRRQPSTVTALGLNLQHNLGGSGEEEFNLARPNSEPQFTRVTASAMHRWYLPASRIHQLRGRFSGIYADKRLVPAKMTTFGGLYSVRGYREDEIVADGGVLAALEYGFSLSRYLGFELPQDQGEVKRFDFKPLNIDSYDIIFLGFTDYGNARIKDPIPGEISSQDLWSAGVGLEVEGGRNFTMRSYLGMALTDTQSVVGIPQTEAGTTRWSFSFLLRY